MDTVEHARLLAGRYRLNSVIGHGGMGTVWRARDELLHRDVAVKEIAWPPSLNEAERLTARRRAVREAQMAARLRHPNVVLIYDIIEEDDRPWIVMEFLPYRSLRDIVLEDGPLPLDRAAQLGLGVLAALTAAHAEGVVHRDVKPANILVGQDGRVVLTDFGIARLADSPTLTASGMLIGSPSYIAPERARGGRADPEGDLWGLGASLYTAVEGRPPFDREGAIATLTAVVADEPDQAARAGALWPVISGLLRKDPATRLTPDEAERMLRRVTPDRGRHWLGGLARRTPAASAPSPPPGSTARNAAVMPVLPADAPRTPPPPAAERRVSAAQAPPEPVQDLEAAAPTTAEPMGHPTPAPAELDPGVPQVPGLVAAESLDPAAEGLGRPAPEAQAAGEEVPEPPERTAPQGRLPAADARPRPGARAAPGPPGRRSRRPVGVLAAALAVTAAAATAIALAWSGPPGHKPAAPSPSPRPGVSTATSGASASPSRTAPSPSTATAAPTQARSSAAPSSTTAGPGAGNGALPAGYYRFTNSTGFSIGVPQGWQISHVGHYVYIRNPVHRGIYLLIDQSDSPKADPLADWRQQEVNREGTYAGYHRIRLESVNYPPAEKAADWEFTYYSSGVLTHVLNRNILANAHHAYALYWATPQSDWNTDYRYFQAFAATFRPAAP